MALPAHQMPDDGRHQSSCIHLGCVLWTAFLVCSFACILPAVCAARSHDNLPPTLKAQLDSLDRPLFDAALRGSITTPVVLRREGGELTLDSGVIMFFAPVYGRVTGAMFFGRAQFIITPPTHLERQQLARFTGDTVRTWTLTELYLRFTDSTCQEIVPQMQPFVAPETKTPNRPPDVYARQIENELYYSFPSRLLIDLHDQTEDGLFYASFDPKEDTRYHFLVDPLLDESVQFWRRPTAVLGDHAIDLVCSWPRAANLALAGGIIADVSGDQITSRHYTLSTSIHEPSFTAVTATLDFVPRRTGLRAVRFDLAARLDIDSVTSPNGAVYYCYNDPELPLNYTAVFPMAGAGGSSGTLDVFWEDPLPRDSTTRVSFSYRGKYLLYQLPWGDFYINESTTWYPAHDWRTRTTYDMYFEFSALRELVAGGRKLEETTEGDRRRSHWVMDYPVRYIGFNYGYFEQLDMPPDSGIPRVDVYRGRNHQGSLFSRDMKKKVGDNIVGALKLYTDVYGPLPFDRLAVTEIPGSHGQGLPQLLHLSWYSFHEEWRGKTDFFRAHEVAHQWWGHLVGWKTYHDQWLSEGFAEFSGEWFVERKYGFKKEARDILTNWRRDIVQRGGRYGWHAGPEVAPIWMGARTSSYDSPGSYSALIYSKGAYVLHMLRMMVRDFKAGSDNRFIALMRDYVRRFRDRSASTEEFKAVVEDHLGGPMDWFFDQWVYGTEIPELAFSSKTTQTADGKFVVSGRITQTEVSQPFRMFVPITLVFAGDKRSTFLQEIKDWKTEFVSPPLPQKPRDIIFNDFQTILCRD